MIKFSYCPRVLVFQNLEDGRSGAVSKDMKDYCSFSFFQ